MSSTEYTALVGKSSTRWRVRCPDCGFSKTYQNHADASSHQRRHACQNCDRMLGVSPVQGVATDGGVPSGEEIEACDICEENPGVASEDVVNDETGEMATAWLCSECIDRMKRYNAGEDDAFADVIDDDEPETATDGGFVRTSDADLAAHDHANALEAALDHVLEAGRRARAGSVGDAAAARLQLATCGTRLAFYATSAEERAVGVHDATEHLETVEEAVEDETVAEPVRRALQLLAGSEDGDAEC